MTLVKIVYVYPVQRKWLQHSLSYIVYLVPINLFFCNNANINDTYFF